MTVDELLKVVADNEAPVTLSGGDPLMQAPAVARLAERIKSRLGYNIWCYTGYTWEQIVGRPDLMAVMRHIDVLVDGPFVLDRRDTTLRFRGSDNQRIIDVPAALSRLAAQSGVTASM